MDAARTTRLFPAYTLAELKATVASVEDGTRAEYLPPVAPENLAKMKAEIAAREEGRSVHRPTPVVGW